MKTICKLSKFNNRNNPWINPVAYAMRSWRHGGTRFYATLLTGRGRDSFWKLWVTAACGKTAAEKFRAEIRLSSNLVPECNDVHYRPGSWFIELDRKILLCSFIL